jgi:hypothetical protein
MYLRTGRFYNTQSISIQLILPLFPRILFILLYICSYFPKSCQILRTDTYDRPTHASVSPCFHTANRSVIHQRENNFTIIGTE